ncbi:(2Fe-2S)-binding protein [Croceicoccus sp. Ery5]|uniref:(2Fe-2S)-binding protein n=1 Tax=Croceicoccus sp. Ery5 TaxID=1703340 RepID=UPI001E54CEE8|nr:(2Fe-2S)-binding protein [Croceicoccus sp. Ery5]
MKITFRLNEKPVSVDADADMPLLWALRDLLGATGTKYGCGIAQCGACTVHVDGKPRRSCVTPVSSIDGRNIATIEGVDDPVAQALQAAWAELDVPQCGFCQSGQIMSAIALLRAVPRPDDAQIDAAMAGNICRCAAYHRIRGGIHLAAAKLDGEPA